MEIIGIIVGILVIYVFWLHKKQAKTGELYQVSKEVDKKEYQEFKKGIFKKVDDLQSKVEAMTKQKNDIAELMIVVKQSTDKYIRASNLHIEAKKELDITLSKFVDTIEKQKRNDNN